MQQKGKIWQRVMDLMSTSSGEPHLVSSLELCCQPGAERNSSHVRDRLPTRAAAVKWYR